MDDLWLILANVGSPKQENEKKYVNRLQTKPLFK